MSPCTHPAQAYSCCCRGHLSGPRLFQCHHAHITPAAEGAARGCRLQGHVDLPRVLLNAAAVRQLPPVPWSGSQVTCHLCGAVHMQSWLDAGVPVPRQSWGCLGVCKGNAAWQMYLLHAVSAQCHHLNTGYVCFCLPLLRRLPRGCLSRNVRQGGVRPPLTRPALPAELQRDFMGRGMTIAKPLYGMHALAPWVRVRGLRHKGPAMKTCVGSFSAPPTSAGTHLLLTLRWKRLRRLCKPSCRTWLLSSLSQMPLHSRRHSSHRLQIRRQKEEERELRRRPWTPTVSQVNLLAAVRLRLSLPSNTAAGEVLL